VVPENVWLVNEGEKVEKGFVCRFVKFVFLRKGLVWGCFCVG